jgi:hypothetical protein
MITTFTTLTTLLTTLIIFTTLTTFTTLTMRLTTLSDSERAEHGVVDGVGPDGAGGGSSTVGRCRLTLSNPRSNRLELSASN